MLNVSPLSLLAPEGRKPRGVGQRGHRYHKGWSTHFSSKSRHSSGALSLYCLDRILCIILYFNMEFPLFTSILTNSFSYKYLTMFFKMKQNIPLLFIKSPFARGIPYNVKTTVLVCWIRTTDPKSYVST